MATILQIHRTPSLGGDTIFANMYAAFDALSEPMKAYLSKLKALHDPERAHRGRFAEKGVDDTGRKFCTQHLAMWDYWPAERFGHRVTVKGDAPFYSPN